MTSEVATAWHAKEVVRSIYTLDNEIVARAFVERLGHDLQDESSPPEVRSLGRTLLRWKDQIVAWHEAHFTNARSETMNNLIKRTKRAAFGFRSFTNYRVRASLRRQAQLGSTRHGHTPLISEAPDWFRPRWSAR